MILHTQIVVFMAMVIQLQIIQFQFKILEIMLMPYIIMVTVRNLQ